MLDLDGTCDLAGVEITPPVWVLLVSKSVKLKSAAEQCLALAMTFYDQRVIAEFQAYAVELEAEAALLQRVLLVTPELSAMPIPPRRRRPYRPEARPSSLAAVRPPHAQALKQMSYNSYTDLTLGCSLCCRGQAQAAVFTLPATFRVAAHVVVDAFRNHRYPMELP